MLLAAFTLFLLFAPAANTLRKVVFDGYQRVFPLERGGAWHVAVVTIDEEALARYGQWPWPRTRMAELVTRISQLKPAAIGLDLLFAEPDRFSPAMMAAEMPILPTNLARALQALPSNDEQLAQAIRGHNVVLGIGSQSLPDPRFTTPPQAAPVVTKGDHAANLETEPGYIGNLPVIDAAAAGRGLMDSGQPDQVVRIVPLLKRVQGVIVPSLGVETLRVALNAGIRLDDAPAGLITMHFDDVTARMQDDGSTWLRMGHEAPDSLSAYEILSGKADAERIRNKIVLVGISGLGVQDYKTTPLGDFVPGVNLHAQVVENLIEGSGLVRPVMMVYAEGLVLVVFGMVLIWFVPRLSALQGINLVLVMVLLLVLTGLTAFRYYQVLFDLAWPAIGTLAVFGGVVVGTLSETERQRRQLREQAAHMAGEVDAARRIQMGLLPDPEEALGDDRRFRLAALLEPARTVGGDFYDFFWVDEDRIFFVVADVSGKGLPAALFMAAAKSNLKSAALRGGTVGEMLQRAQAEIERENSEQLFVTAFAAILDVRTGELQFSSAGHEPPFVRTPRGAPERFSTPEGPPLCVVPGFKYSTGGRRMQPGEWLCVVTDGATEAMDPSRSFFGVERLRASLSWMPEDVDPRELVRRLRDDVARFAAGAEPADDITLLALRWISSGR
ncbi:MAG TPA: CHASE2 domain-containing protein [Usitatibacter sp.]|nr:CHASE2 domain-containing protein [Usitatibacter sp.]